MNAALLGTIVALAASTVCWTMASLGVGALWRWQRLTVLAMTAGVRAQALAALRLLPAGAAAVTLPLVFVNFVRFEPAHTSEIAGVVLGVLACAGLVAITIGLARAARACRATTQVLRRWSAPQPVDSGELPIVTVDATFPVVAVVGIVRPRLYMARTVLESCSRRELQAMIAHEAAHVASQDNLTRLLFLCAPMLSVASCTARELEQAWTGASEEAADDRARGDAHGSLALASALIKVSRLAAGQQPPLLHASAISSGSAIEHRVRRLLEPTTSDVPNRARVVAAGAFILIGTGAASLALDRHIYEVAEHCIRNLP